MSQNRIVLDAAAFVDSSQAARIDSADRQGIQEVAQRFLTACYDDAGEAPKLLDGEGLHTILERLLPLRFGIGDGLIESVPAVLTAFFQWLWENEHVVHQFEQAQKLEESLDGFLVVARSGAAHVGGQSLGSTKTVAHRTDKTGRNDPCPCGSGKKFKKCCMSLS